MIARFGPFTLDAARRQLSRDHIGIHLTPKAFDLLALLLSEAPRVLGKAELHEKLWPRTYVSDATLVGLVKELRRALDDRDPGAPVIRTVHRIGYAFGLEVEKKVQQPVPTWSWLVFSGRRVGLRRGENLIGRDPACDVWLDVAGVSRRHARIVVDGEDVRVEDLGSKNGTTVDDQPVRTAVSLCDGARLQFASVVAVYRASAAGMSTETHSRNAVRSKKAGVDR